jgi:hypothetical protein
MTKRSDWPRKKRGRLGFMTREVWLAIAETTQPPEVGRQSVVMLRKQWFVRGESFASM